MASRSIKPEDAATLANLGDMTSPACEHVVGLDGLAVIVNKNNPVSALSKIQVAKIFIGEMADGGKWAERPDLMPIGISPVDFFEWPRSGTMIMVAKTVDSYRFLDGVAKRAIKRWAGLPGETHIPWTPLAKPLSQCTVSLVCSAAIALKSDPPFDLEIERRDPWFSDPSYRVVPRTTQAGDIQVSHLHINPCFAEQDLNSVFPVERLNELAELGEIGAAAPSHYSYMGYTLRPAPLLREALPGMVRRFREEVVDVVALVPV